MKFRNLGQIFKTFNHDSAPLNKKEKCLDLGGFFASHVMVCDRHIKMPQRSENRGMKKRKKRPVMFCSREKHHVLNAPQKPRSNDFFQLYTKSWKINRRINRKFCIKKCTCKRFHPVTDSVRWGRKLYTSLD